ncbi:MAG TPA: hypothetical protein VIL48_00995 [Acidimicrobiales bacterium]
MSPTTITVAADQPISSRLLRPLLGSSVTVRTASGSLQGTLLSCVKGSAWFVVDDKDVVVPLDDIISVRAA